MTVTHVFATKRLALEQANGSIGVEYLSRMVKWLNDPEIVRHSEQRHKIHSLKNQLAYIESFIWPNQFRLIILDNELIGTMTAYVDSPNSVADIGILLDKTKQGKGYGTEAWLGLMEHLFGMGVRKVEAGCMSVNIPMITVFQKSGMFPEGIRQRHFISSQSKGGYTMCDLDMWGKFKDG